MIRLVRVTAEPLNRQHSSVPIHLDVLLDENGLVADDEPILGYEGSLSHKTGKCAPFVLYDNGELDYGDEAAEVSIATLDIRSRPLEFGSRLELVYNGDVRGYKVIRVDERLKSI